jgi:biopolymer transport protein TolR
MSPLRRVRRRHIAEINVVPYIDVMLVLLVIFMITAPLINQGVEIDLPQADASPLETSELRTLLLEVDRQGIYYLHLAGDPPEPLAGEQILARVAAILRSEPRTPVVVQADAAVDYGTVVQAMALLQQAGAPRVGLSTQPLER